MFPCIVNIWVLNDLFSWKTQCFRLNVDERRQLKWCGKSAKHFLLAFLVYWLKVPIWQINLCIFYRRKFANKNVFTSRPLIIYLANKIFPRLQPHRSATCRTVITFFHVMELTFWINIYNPLLKLRNNANVLFPEKYLQKFFTEFLLFL